MKKIITIIILGIFVSTIVWFRGGLKTFFLPSTVRAFGDLFVDFHVPAGTPLFSIVNMKPGDQITKTVDVLQNGNDKKTITIKGMRTGGVGGLPRIENALAVTISDGAIVLYGQGSPTGAKTLANFFAESMSGNTATLGQLQKKTPKTYTFHVSFPQTSGNEFQNKSVVFDVTFDSVKTNK